MGDSHEDVMRRELDGDKKELWSGCPRQGLVLRLADIFLIPFSLMWGGFAIFWEIGVISSGAPLFFALWGVPFVLVGLYIIVGRFWLDALQRSRTFYGVTSERVIIVNGIFARRVKSLAIENITDVSLTERGNGAGTITFGAVPPFFWWYGGMQLWSGDNILTCFELSSEARQVYEIIREAQRAARTRA